MYISIYLSIYMYLSICIYISGDQALHHARQEDRLLFTFTIDSMFEMWYSTVFL